MKKFGFPSPNIEFILGYIENLETLGIKDESIDVVVSNCVINLSPDKNAVFREILRVLKPGGEIYFSDVFADRRIPSALQSDQVLLGECLAGALYIEDFRRMLNQLGISDYRVISSRQLTLGDSDIARKIGMVDFYSKTIRAFKVTLEDICEDYGHVAYYKGTIEESPHYFLLDDHHRFDVGKPVPVCSNTANMLTQSRFSSHFRVEGDFSTHYGPFDCAAPSTANTESGCC